MKHFKIAIIGSGPAGIACAIQLKRLGFEPVIFERKVPGSILRMANLVENYPGFPEGIRGEDLFRLFRDQIEKFQVNHILKEVSNVRHEGDKFLVSSDDEEISSDILVVASGTSPVQTIPQEWNEDVKKHLFYDISEIPQSPCLSIGIIGLGDAAFDYALNLQKSSHRVCIFGRDNRILANKALLQYFRKVNDISLYLDHELISIDDPIEGKINCHFRNNDLIHTYKLGYLIFATGRKAALEFLNDELIGRKEELIANKRLYFAGDVKNGEYRQVAIATGDGIRVAMEIFNYEGNSEDCTK